MVPKKVNLSPSGKTAKKVIAKKVCYHKLEAKKTNNFTLIAFFLLNIRMQNYPEYTGDWSYLTATLSRL